jgi:ribosomal protein S18 acetylase RimI-like enzyme
VQIRELRFPNDYPEVERLWATMENGINLGRSDSQKEIQKKLARDPDLFLVAEEDEQIIGTVMGGFDGRRGSIYHLAVAASYRRQGIGSRLMNEIESRLRAKGCLRCYLMVTTNNEEAMRYYEKHGWERIDYVVSFTKDLDQAVA